MSKENLKNPGKGEKSLDTEDEVEKIEKDGKSASEEKGVTHKSKKDRSPSKKRDS